MRAALLFSFSASALLCVYASVWASPVTMALGLGLFVLSLHAESAIEESSK